MVLINTGNINSEVMITDNKIEQLQPNTLKI